MSALPPKADIPHGELCAITDEKQRDRLGHKAASKRDKGGTGGTGLVPSSFKLTADYLIAKYGQRVD